MVRRHLLTDVGDVRLTPARRKLRNVSVARSDLRLSSWLCCLCTPLSPILCTKSPSHPVDGDVCSLRRSTAVHSSVRHVTMTTPTSHVTFPPLSSQSANETSACVSVDPSTGPIAAAVVDDHVDSSLVQSVLAAPLYGSRAAQHDIHAYLHNKRIKIRHQYQNDALAASTFNSALATTATANTTPLPATPATLFSSCIFWLNGLTSPPAGQLLPLIYRFGGRVENKLVAVVTHCVSENLPSTKVRDWKDKSRHKRWWVVGGWVLECIRRGRLVAEWEWLVPELRDDGMRTVRGMLGMPAADVSNSGQADEVMVDEEQEAAAQQPLLAVAKGASCMSHGDASIEQEVASASSVQSVQQHSLPQQTAPTPSTSSPTVFSSTAADSPPIISAASPQWPAHTIHATPTVTTPPSSHSLLSLLLSSHTANSASVAPFVAPHQPLSFRSISTSSTHSVPPPPPPPDYQNLLLPARPYDTSQHKTRAVSRVMTSTTITTQPHTHSSTSVVPPATRPYLPRSIVQQAAVAQSAQQTQTVNPLAPAAHATLHSPAPSPPVSHSLIPGPQAGTSLPVSSPPVPASSSPSTSATSGVTAPSPSSLPTYVVSSATCAATSSSPSSSSSSVLLPSSMGPTAHQGGPAPRLAGRSTLNDPHFVQTFFAASRLHFIGSWKRLFQALIPALLAIPSRFTASAYPAASTHRGYILHCDLDSFFASVAARDHPALKDKPVAVCHATAADSSSAANSISSTSSISSCNYVARGYGLHAEMSIGRARRLCPELVVVPYEFEKYAAASEDIYRIFFSVTHRVQAVSLDECYMELPGNMKREEAEEVARDVRKRVETTTGVQLSIGISHSLLLARLATKRAKPNNLFYLPNDPAVLSSYMADLPASDVPGIGYVNSRRLEEDMKVTTCAELQQVSREKLQQLFGKKQGVTIYESCRGVDHRPLVPVRAAGEDKSVAVQRSIAVNINYGIRFERDEQVLLFLHDLSDELLSRLLFTPLCSQLLSMKLMVRHPNAPIEPPHKFLGHGVCETRSKSKPIDGRPLGESVVERGSDEERRERDRLRAMVIELWLRLKEEWKFVVSDLRGVGLQFTKMKRRDGRADKMEAFKAYGFTSLASPAKSDGTENRGRVDGAMEMAGNDEEEEWKDEDGMEVDDDNEWSHEHAHSDDAKSHPIADDPLKSVIGLGVSETAATAPAALPSRDVETGPPPVDSVASIVAAPTLESLLRSALAMTLSSTMQHSSVSAASPTVALPLDQLLRLLATVSQHSGLSSLSLSETLTTLASKASGLLAPSNSVSASSPTLTSLAPSSSVSAAAPSSSHALSTSASSISKPHIATAAQTSSNSITSPTASMPSPASAPVVAAAVKTDPRSLTISEVVAEVDAAKERAYLAALPAFAALDRCVIAALPFEVRQELANAYKQKRAMEKAEDEKAEAEKRRSAAVSRLPAPAATAALHSSSSNSTSSASAAALIDLPRFSQVDPSVLADLPPSIRAELELEYKRRGANVPTQQRSPPNQTRTTKGKKAKGKLAEKGRQTNKPAAAAPLAAARPMNSVSIVDHFTVAEHEQRQQQRNRMEREQRSALQDSDVQIVQWTRSDTRLQQPVSRRQLNMEAADQQRQYGSMDEKYGDDESEDRLRKKREKLREEKEVEQRRRDRPQGSTALSSTAREQRMSANSSSSLHAPAFAVVDPSLLPHLRRPSSSIPLDGSAALSSPTASLVSDGDGFVASLRSLSRRFIPISSLQPHLSIWLRTLRTRHPHLHPAFDCDCDEPVIGCFCHRCPRWQALLAFLSAQARLRNAELVAAAVAALRSSKKLSQSIDDRRDGDRRVRDARQEADERRKRDKQCLCFTCSVELLVGEVQKVVEDCYDGVLKCS